MTARITAMASYLPKRVMTNKDLEKLVETSDEWIVSRTGMKERRISGDGEHTSDMGAFAVKKLLEEKGVSPLDIDMLIVATMTPDHFSPNTASIIQNKVGAFNAAAMDLQAACSGYIYGLNTAKAFIEAGIYKNILIVASEKLSPFIDYTDRNTCVLFGDGAAACLVQKDGPGFAIGKACLGADGSLGELLLIEAGASKLPASEETVKKRQHYLKMTGKELFKHAVRRMEGAIKDCLKANGKKESDVSWLVPHQANGRIIDAMGKRLSLPEKQVYKTIHKYGNTSASSVGIALDELTREDGITINEGENIMLVAFGAGLTWGAALLTRVIE